MCVVCVCVSVYVCACDSFPISPKHVVQQGQYDRRLSTAYSYKDSTHPVACYQSAYACPVILVDNYLQLFLLVQLKKLLLPVPSTLKGPIGQLTE